MKKQLRKVISRALMTVFIFMFVFALVVTNVLHDYEVQVNDFLGIDASYVEGGSDGKMYFKTDYKNSEEEFQAKSALVREIVQEGTVLLKNDNNALPVNPGTKVAVYFRDITAGYTEEAGAGGFFVVDGQDVHNGEESFIYATNHPGASYKDNSNAFTGDFMTSTTTSLTEALEFDGLDVTKVCVPDAGGVSSVSGCDTAFVVLGRVAGERSDLDYGVNINSLELTSAEKSLIELAKSSNAKHVVVIVSGDHAIEIADIKTDSRIEGIIKIGNVGYRGAYGLADVITGKVAPSGRLVDTYAASNKSAPANANFGNYLWTNASEMKTSESDAYVANMEGIYVDYKYYETRYEDYVLGRYDADSTAGAVESKAGWTYAEEVVYPYGYGISYTTFEQEIVGEPIVNAENRTATVKVKVTNTGDVAAKEVVTVYGQAPYTQYDIDNRVEKASVQLLGFSKTDVIEPGAENAVEIDVTVHLQWLASFDYMSAKTYIMDSGDYYFALGNGAHDALNNILAKKNLTDVQKSRMTGEGDASKAYTWHQDEFDATTYSTSVYSSKDFKIDARFEDADINYWYGKDAYTYLTRSNWKDTYPETLTLTATKEMVDYLNNTNRFLDKVDDTYERAEALAEDVTYNTADKVTEPLVQVATMIGKDYDDAGWDEILNSFTAKEMSDMLNKGGKLVNPTVSINFPGAAGTDNPIGLNVGNKYTEIDNETGKMTSVSGETLVTDGINNDVQIDLNKVTSTMYASLPTLAATFNVELAYREGVMQGEDGLYTDQEWNWGLGANLHRSQYCGRLSEYFSADSVHSSLMGAAEAKGAWSKGFVLVAKHFTTNDQESNRQGVVTFINEQAFRENQLRAFEGILANDGTGTYGEAKGVMGTYNRLGLIGCTCAEYDLMTEVLRNEWDYDGYVITDLCGHFDGLYEGQTMLVAGTDIMLAAQNHGDLSASKIVSDKVVLSATRRAMHRLLYVYVNSAAMNSMSTDGRIVLLTPWWSTLCSTFEIVFGTIAVLSTCWYIYEFNFGNKKSENAQSENN